MVSASAAGERTQLLSPAALAETGARGGRPGAAAEREANLAVKACGKKRRRKVRERGRVANQLFR
jgi:hypothetical protein